MKIDARNDPCALWISRLLCEQEQGNIATEMQNNRYEQEDRA